MKISRRWLQTFFDTPLPDAEVLADALTFHAFEIDGIEMRETKPSSKEADAVLDVKVTANRGHDCLCHFGIAKELSAILQIPLKEYPHTLPLSIITERKTDVVSVSIDTPLCHRYIAGYVSGVGVGPSPAWLVERLESMGQKSINNVVDATNFVMFNIGQPLHAFDASKVRDNNISIRSAHDGEKMTALDSKEYTLNASMLVIADTDSPIGIAGVKGGTPASITSATTDIIIESANFDGVSVRKTAQQLRLRTDASARFEQVISPELAAYGMRAVVELIQELAGGEIVGFVDTYPHPQETKTVSVSLAQINATLGTSLTTHEVANVFTRLGFTFTQNDETCTVTPPFERLDLVIAEDLIEEVGRIIGYDKVPAIALPPFEKKPEVNKNFYWSEKIREHLIAQGFSEVFTSVFADKGERIVANKVDGVRPYLRTNLSDGLADALTKNTRTKDLLGLKQVKIFEIGTVWSGGKEEITYDLAVEKVRGQKTAAEYKKELDTILATLPEEKILHHTSKVESDALNTYRPFSKYPFIVRDIALWVPEGTGADDVLVIIREHAGDLLVRVDLFDEFTKGDRVSYAFRLVFQSFDRTLFDGDANERMESVTKALAAHGFEIR